MDLSQQKVMEGAGLAVQKLALDSAEADGAGLAKLMQVTDPALGGKVDINL